jgi:hypothetical protein
MFESDLKKNRNDDKIIFSAKNKRKSSLDNFNDSLINENELSQQI